MIRGAKTIAEYAIRKWLESEHFEMRYFKLAMEGNAGVVTDSTGASIRLVYDDTERIVYVAE